MQPLPKKRWDMLGSEETLHILEKAVKIVSRCLPPEGKRMASRLIRNQLPGNRLRVRAPCPPLSPICHGACQLLLTCDTSTLCEASSIPYILPPVVTF